MKKIILFFFIAFLLSFSDNSEAQNQDKKLLFQRFREQYNAGDLINAEGTLHLFLKFKVPLTEGQLTAAYNNLGAVYTFLGRYKDALDYYNRAENIISNKQRDSISLGIIYINKAIIYGYQKSYSLATEYFEKGIRIYLNQNSSENNVISGLASAYLNSGIVFLETKNYKSALENFKKSADIKSRYKIPGLELVYLNFAKTYVITKNPIKAEEYYLKSISGFKNEFGDEYYRVAEVYFDYGLFLRSVGKNIEALEIHKKALEICLKNYGEKHTLVSLSYKHIGDDYLHQNKLDSALYFYQQSLIAVDKTFDNPDIFTNPSIDSSLFDIRLLDNLKSKAQALELLAVEQNDPGMKLKTMGKSLETIELTLRLIDRIRNNYPSEESRIYLAENEKETYLFATHLAYSLYSTTHEESIGIKMYGIAQKAKAAVLRNEITGNELLYSAGIPDSLREKQNRLTGNIAAYNNLILEETRKTNPDSNKISLWKDALFDMNREKENVSDNIERVFPQYHDLIRKTEPVSVQLIQKQLKKDETIVDYLLSNQYSGEKRKLYIFLISRDSLEFREAWLDSLFVKNAEIIRETANPSIAGGAQNSSFIIYTGALNYMYNNLIKPVEDLFRGNKLIIIPDEEIGWLSFDAFLKIKPESDQTDYERLHYLINDYTFSYGYSSSMIFNKNSRVRRGAEVFTFSPDYHSTIVSGKILSSLQGAGVEIGSIHKWFRGKNFRGENATRANFIQALQNPVIFHLAMHSMSDSLNSRYSYLIFDTHNDSSKENKLYNYEISLNRIKSPMVVLSACNSGTGTLYYGEGLMSLARSFTLAGASSVIKTAWEINDESSAAIITHFYWHLSKGKEKNEAMRLAKLEYLKSSSPAFTNPYYWAAYEVLGDNAPVARNIVGSVIIVSLVVILSVGMLLFYFKRRRIFSDRSR
ncbi:MAG: CHAT domain-containing tetratricopeptide repeat protein [Bacteroidales bacterium]